MWRLALSTALFLASQAMLFGARYEIDSSLSYLDIIPGMPANPNQPTIGPVPAGTRLICNYPIVEQQPGSLRTFIAGSMDVTINGASVAVASGNVIDALPNPSGPFDPPPGSVGSSGIEDNYGGVALGTSILDAAIRDAMVTISGTLTNGQVAEGLETEFVDGVLDYQLLFNLGEGSIGLTPADGFLESFLSSADSGILQVSPDESQIILPVSYDVAWDATGAACSDGSLPERLTLEAMVIANRVCEVGDFDCDGDYSCADVDLLIANMISGTNSAEFDLTGDGLVDDADLTAWLAEAGAAELPSGAAYLRGDANLDGVVDVPDFNAWNGAKFTSAASWCRGDFNGDGSVDVPDFNLWNGNKFQSADSPQVVPEPAAWDGLALGLSLLARRSGR